jgi:hypothetical protein
MTQYRVLASEGWQSYIYTKPLKIYREIKVCCEEYHNQEGESLPDCCHYNGNTLAHVHRKALRGTTYLLPPSYTMCVDDIE